VPKIKTHKSTAKRFKISGTGKLLRAKLGKSHLRRRRSKRTKRMLDKTMPVTHAGDVKRIRKLVPYLKNK